MPDLAFCALGLVSIAVFWLPLQQWAALCRQDHRYTHLILTPVISAWVVFMERRKVFATAAFCGRRGILLLSVALALCVVVRSPFPLISDHYTLSVQILALVLVWTTAFALCYGLGAVVAARFPFAFLLLMGPIPSNTMDRIVLLLQRGSAEMTDVLFTLGRVSVFRDGFCFDLGTVSIVISSQCSSVHSAWALFLVALVLGHRFLRSAPAKLCLSVFTLPIAIFTNGVRIVTLCLLSTTVDAGYLNGKLHHEGGVLFSGISALLLVQLLWVLRQLETRRPRLAAAAVRTR